MKKIIAKAIMVATVLVGTVSAGWIHDGGSWKEFKVNSIVVEGGSNGNVVHVSFTPGIERTTNGLYATSGSYGWVRLDASNQKGKIIYASLLQAQSTGQDVQLSLSSQLTQPSEGYSGRFKIDAVCVKKPE